MMLFEKKCCFYVLSLPNLDSKVASSLPKTSVLANSCIEVRYEFRVGFALTRRNCTNFYVKKLCMLHTQFFALHYWWMDRPQKTYSQAEHTKCLGVWFRSLDLSLPMNTKSNIIELQSSTTLIYSLLVSRTFITFMSLAFVNGARHEGSSCN